MSEQVHEDGRTIGRLEGAYTGLEARLRQVETDLAVVKATAVTPARLLAAFSVAFGLAAVVFGLFAGIGDRLWGG